MYFDEVVSDMEYTDGDGDVSLVQKWTSPIRYYIYGTPTLEDIAVLNTLFYQLNQIPGFPGISETTISDAANLTLNFLDSEEFYESFSEVTKGEEAFGAAQFWYFNLTNEIHTAQIGYRTDIDQYSRNSVLLEEIVNVLGISDSLTRTDSIVYQYSNSNMELSDVDWLIIKLLYNPAITCGMNASDYASTIATLYY